MVGEWRGLPETVWGREDRKWLQSIHRYALIGEFAVCVFEMALKLLRTYEYLLATLRRALSEVTDYYASFTYHVSGMVMALSTDG